MIQVIKYKCCGKVFAACREPECHTDEEWIKDAKKYQSQGHTVEMVNDTAMGKCECSNVKTFEQFAQEQVGAIYPPSMIVSNTETEDIDQIATDYAKYYATEAIKADREKIAEVAKTEFQNQGMPNTARRVEKRINEYPK